ncbi:hypothetical protein PsorP6_017469 [Peronosclerospora sorghi]|uniref:Uncharacterized protein n=1 Tax=Peronosclerospora sorghi TaxID=230839 RepID=A0ACC0WL25_9STRA|nr:hypothetical protein PsorP6_017469 [Peronosclerospora sorghi]
MTGQSKHGAQVAVGEAVRVAEFGDEKLGVSSKAGGVVQKIVELDERLGVSATAVKVDSKVTGSLGNKVAATTVGIVSESVNYISEILHNAKLTAQQSAVAQNFEPKGVAVADVATENNTELKSTFNEGFKKGRGKIGMATVKTKEKFGQVNDVTKEKAIQAKDKAGQSNDFRACRRERRCIPTQYSDGEDGMIGEEDSDIERQLRESLASAEDEEVADDDDDVGANGVSRPRKCPPS